MDQINDSVSVQRNFQGIEIVQKEPFTATGKEILFACISYLSGWCYANIFMLNYYEEERAWYTFALAVLLVFSVEMLSMGRKYTVENWLLLGCFIVCTAVFALSGIYYWKNIFLYPVYFERIWDRNQLFLFVHIFFVWYALSRSGKMLEKETGHLLPADVADAFVIIPLGNLFLRVKTLLFGIKGIGKKREKKEFPWFSVMAAMLSLGLLISAVSLLMDADETFRRLFKDIYEFFSFEADEMLMMKLVLSIPVGAWLYGLIGGCYRTKEDTLERRRSAIYIFLEDLKKVPSKLWTVVIGIFSLVYILFFAIQGNYLFSAFFGKLPDGFIVSEYARRGFFELCKVMGLNFVLLWMATRSADEKTRDSGIFKTACISLLAESMLFSAVSISKLCLYISSFGFTPLRLQSSWLAGVLFMGCAMWMYSLLTEKKVFKYWMYFGAVTLTAMAVI